MLMHVTAHRGCANSVGESALEVDSGKKNPLPHQGIEPASELYLAFWSNALQSELSYP